MVMKGVASGWTEVTAGVPQGSILMFTVFVNDMPEVVKHCSINQYADNTTIYSSDTDPEVVGSALEEDLGRLSSWITANRLKMNIAKTQLMILCRRGKQVVADSVKVCIEGVELPN